VSPAALQDSKKVALNNIEQLTGNPKENAMSKFSRSWALVKASGKVLQQDKELMVFPLLSAIASIVLVATFVLPLIAANEFQGGREFRDGDSSLLVLGFLFYLCQYFVIFFFNAALVGAATIRLEGGDPTVADGLKIAASKFIPILGYAAIAATVGLILRVIEERAGFIGRWIAGILGVAFTIATFLVVPILVSREIGPIDAVKESAGLLKKTWGENIIGNAGMGFAFMLIYFFAIAVGVGLIYTASLTGSAMITVAAVGVLIVAIVVLALIHAALQGVYSAALYRYVTTGAAGTSFDGDLMQGAFRQKV
jgi:hypothetical protein